MAYCLQQEHQSQIEIVKTTFEKWTNFHPDIFLMSSDGDMIHTQKILLKFYSPLLSDMFEASSKEDVGISLPASTSTIVHMMEVLTTGAARTKHREDLSGVAEVAKMIGIDFENWQIRGKNEILKHEGEKRVKKRRVTKLVSNDSKDLLETTISSLDCHSKECNICGNKFSHRIKLETHIRTHFKSRTRQCSQCGLAFKNVQQMQRHNQIVHDGERIALKQEDDDISTKNFIEDQINLQDSLTATDKTCSICGYHNENNDRWKIERHVKTHFKAHHSHKCDKCGLGFRNQYQMECHFKLVHDGQSVTSVPTPIEEVAGEVGEIEETISCNLDEESYLTENIDNILECEIDEEIEKIIAAEDVEDGEELSETLEIPEEDFMMVNDFNGK